MTNPYDVLLFHRIEGAKKLAVGVQMNLIGMISAVELVPHLVVLRRLHRLQKHLFHGARTAQEEPRVEIPPLCELTFGSALTDPLAVRIAGRLRIEDDASIGKLLLSTSHCMSLKSFKVDL